MKISLISVVYNNASGLRNSLFSSFQQKYSNVERIVIDGASNDGTLDVMNEFQSSLEHIISEPDLGIYDALNKGVSLATGDVIGNLHSDDLFPDSDVLSRVAEVFVKTDVEFLYGDLCYVSSINPKQIVRHWKANEYSPNSLVKGWMPPHPTVYVRRELFERFGDYNLRYKISSDYDWLLRLLGDESLRVAYLPHVLVLMRTGGASNRSLSNLWKKSWEDWDIIRHHQIGGIKTLFFKNISKIPQFLSHRKNFQSMFL